MTRAKQLIFLLITIVILVIAIAGLVSLKNLLTNDSYRITTSTKTVIKELQKLNRLETASFTIEKIIDAKTEGNRFQELLFGDQLLLIAHGEVIAGFDLSKLDEKGIEIEGTTLRLTLPPPQVLVTDIDNEQTRVYDRRTGLLTKGDKDLEAKARQAAETTIAEAACQGGILTQASTNARSQLTALFKTLGFTTVVITTPSASC